MIRKSFAVALSVVALAACDDSVSPGAKADQFAGRWEQVGDALPPVTLSVRAEGDGHVGQVWLSGVTYTLPATFDDSTVVLSHPMSSTRAPFVGRLVRKGVMRARLIPALSDVQFEVDLVRK